VLCRCDLYPAAEPDEPISARMTHTVFAIEPTASLDDAAEAMARAHVGCLPVVAGDAVLGVITRGDLRRAGAPEELLGAMRCTDCGSPHGVRAYEHSGLELCLDCIDLADACDGALECGEGD
jgi:signal-transduction protein with cAMP-binding, CBS, and nucleotidyltransferase domain